MIDNKSVVSQAQELQVTIHDLLAEVVAIIEKLPPMWKDFKNYLKHKRKEMTVEDLIVRLCIEEDNKVVERRSKGNSTINGAYIVEDNQNNSKKRKKAEQESHQPKKKFKGKCFNYGKIDHKSTDCRASKKEEMIYMVNSATAKVEGTGKICLKMTSGNVLTLNNVCDANWITGSNEVKSTSGYVFTIDGRTVSWKLSKQNCIARSTMESEFIVLDKAGEEAEWLQNFLEDIPYWPKPVAPICIHCDSQAAIGRAGNMMYNVNYVKSKDNESDPVTKDLSREGVERTSKEMSLRPRTSQHGGNSTYQTGDSKS
ncbi:hypothetical protein BC332_29158 [Capsicum chinense]|nr:hypothetical protein BC332_29158 [Capsicum chinense]